MKYFVFTIFLLLSLFLTSCALDMPQEKPQLEDVFTVTDLKLLSDGNHFVILKAN